MKNSKPPARSEARNRETVTPPAGHACDALEENAGWSSHAKELPQTRGQKRARFQSKAGFVAERADLHWTFISGVERCKYNVSLDSLVRIARALGREPHALLM